MSKKKKRLSKRKGSKRRVVKRKKDALGRFVRAVKKFLED